MTCAKPSQVMSAPEENARSVQNAVEVMDYASATSNMQKDEVLTQTGTAALTPG
jgi:flagellin-like hook-associated protein FlgL